MNEQNRQWETINTTTNDNDAMLSGHKPNDHLGSKVVLSKDGSTIVSTSIRNVQSVQRNQQTKNWERHQNLILGNKQPSTLSISGDGQLLIVGTPLDDALEYRAGSTNIYRLEE